MKRFFYLFAVAAIVFGMMTFTSCGKEEDNVPNTQNDTTGQIQGTWKMSSENDDSVVIITDSTMTISSEGQWKEVNNASYNEERGELNTVLTEEYLWNEDTGEWELSTDPIDPATANRTYFADILDNNNVLALTAMVEDWNGTFYEETVKLLYRDGATITSDVNTLQGLWYWYMFGDRNAVRVAVKFTDNNVELYVPGWSSGEKYTGTYTYQNGFVHMTLDKFYLREASENDDQGHPETANYALQDPSDPDFWGGPLLGDQIMPFFANGTRAYGIFANLDMLLYNQ